MRKQPACPVESHHDKYHALLWFLSKYSQSQGSDKLKMSWFRYKCALDLRKTRDDVSKGKSSYTRHEEDQYQPREVFRRSTVESSIYIGFVGAIASPVDYPRRLLSLQSIHT